MDPLISSIDHVTPHWLTAEFRRGGYEHFGEVRDYHVRHVRKSQVSRLAHLELNWSEDANTEPPTRVCLKLAIPSTTPFSDREVMIYTRVGTQMESPPLVKCFSARHSAALGRYYLLLEDVSETHRTEPPGLPLTVRDAEAVVDTLAAFHAAWWDHPKLTEVEGPLVSDFAIRRMVGYAQSHWPGIRDKLADRFSADNAALIEKTLAGAANTFTERRDTRRHFTIVHTDAHVKNLLLPRDPRQPENTQVYLIDWQTAEWVWRVWTGVSDLAYLMMRFWPVERTQTVGKRLIERYHRRLIEHGVCDYDLTALWSDFGDAAAMNVCIAIHEAAAREPRVWFPQLLNITECLKSLATGEFQAATASGLTDVDVA